MYEELCWINTKYPHRTAFPEIGRNVETENQLRKEKWMSANNTMHMRVISMNRNFGGNMYFDTIETTHVSAFAIESEIALQSSVVCLRALNYFVAVPYKTSDDLNIMRVFESKKLNQIEFKAKKTDYYFLSLKLNQDGIAKVNKNKREKRKVRKKEEIIVKLC